MKKGALLLGAILLTSCFDANGYWTDTQTINMSNFAKSMFSEIKGIISNYDALITEEKYSGSYRISAISDGCFVYPSQINFNIQETSYIVGLNLVPDDRDEISIHNIILIVEGPKFTNPEECVFYKEQYIAMDNLLDYFDNYVSAKSFINLDDIENYLGIAKENYSDETMGGAYKETVKDKQCMVDYRGRFSYAKDSDANVFHNFFSLSFIKCSRSFTD